MTQTPHAPTGHPSTPPLIGKPQVDRTRPQPARRYDYWLGGKDNFAADRASGDRIAEAFPTIRTAVIENRRFLVRVVRHLAARGIHGDDSIRTFLGPRLTDLHDPSLIPDLDRAAARMLDALRAGEPVVIYGDYDVDGITATAILFPALVYAIFRYGMKVLLPEGLLE